MCRSVPTYNNPRTDAAVRDTTYMGSGELET